MRNFFERDGPLEMSKKKKDTVTYDLKRGNEIVYRGTTNGPERRAQEHFDDDGKAFTHLVSRPAGSDARFRVVDLGR